MTGLTVDDFNGDAQLDLAVASGDVVRVFLGEGSGEFRAGDTYSDSGTGSSLIGADFNGDGLLDLAVTRWGALNGAIDLLLGNGDGSFGRRATYEVEGAATCLFTWDLNADGRPDLITVHSNSNYVDRVAVFLNAPWTDFAAAAIVSAPTSVQSENVLIEYVLRDVESASCRVTVEYSLDGGSWHTATAAAGGDGNTGLSSSPTGRVHSFVWASGTDLANINSSNVRIRITPRDAAEGIAGTTASFTVKNRANEAPTATVILDSHAPITDTSLTANATKSDVDGDPVSLTFVWKVNGVVVRTFSSTTALSDSLDLSVAGHGDAGDVVAVEVTPSDAEVDGTVVSDAATVMNDAPVAARRVLVTDEDLATSRTVSANDADGDPLSYSVVTEPAHGTLAFNPDGTFTYTPAANYNGSDSFAFKAYDGKTDSNTAVVDITVSPVNDAPVASAQNTPTNEDTAVSGTVSATDVDGDPLSYSVVTEPAHGTVTLNPDGTFTYTPLANYNGSDSFAFKAGDGLANSDVATVTITVVPVNDAPAVADSTVVTDEDVAVNGSVTANDVEGDAITYRIVTGPQSGSLTLEPDGRYTYTPAANYFGSDSFTFVANDDTADSNVATVSVTVAPVNDAPVAADSTIITNEDVALNGSVAATDVDEDTLTYRIVTGPEHGLLVLQPEGQFTYTPNADFNGSDSFTFVANDGTSDSSVATVSVTVAPVNDAPVAADSTIITNEDVALNGSVAAADVDEDTLTYRIVTGPEHGTLVLEPDGRFTYTPAANYFGSDSFTFVANDDTADSNVATVTVTVTPVNDAPVAAESAVMTDEDVPVSGSVVATDIEGDALTYRVMTGPAHGTLILQADGRFEYTPAENCTGSDSFTFVANDGAADSSTATVTVILASVNDAPVAADVTVSSKEDTGTKGFMVAADVESETLHYRVVDMPEHGDLAPKWDGWFIYTPDANYFGSDSFTFVASDGTSDSNVATVTITVTPVNDSPVATNATFMTNEDVALSGSATAADVDGDVLTYSVVTAPKHGTFVLNPDGQFTYTPAANYAGSDSFTVVANDGTSDSNVATVTVTVAPVNDAPVASNNAVESYENVAVSGPLAATDVDGDALTYRVSAAPTHGTLVLEPDGRFTYTPNGYYSGTDSFGFVASDGVADSNVGTVTLTINAVNQVPSGLSLTNASLAENLPAGTVVGRLTAEDVDFGETFTFELVSGEGSADNGSFNIVGDELRTVASLDYETKSSYSIRVRVTDAGGLSREQSFAITVEDVAETPTPWVIEGTSGDDYIVIEPVGTDYRLTFNGLVSFRPADLVSSTEIHAGAGNDIVTIAPGVMGTTVLGEAGNDTITGSSGADLIYGGDGNDVLLGGDGIDTIYGNFGDDVIAGGLKRDSIMGGLGADTISGEDGPDTLLGGDQRDLIFGGTGADYIEGRGKADTIRGGDGNDTINSGAGSDLVYGENGDDVLDAWSGAMFHDTLNGGAGWDRYDAADGDLLVDVEEQLLV